MSINNLGTYNCVKLHIELTIIFIVITLSRFFLSNTKNNFIDACCQLFMYVIHFRKMELNKRINIFCPYLDKEAKLTPCLYNI